MFTQIKEHIIELTGTAGGLLTGVLAMIQGQIILVNDLHAVLIAFVTGAAGGLGAIMVKWFWNKYVKNK